MPENTAVIFRCLAASGEFHKRKINGRCEEPFIAFQLQSFQLLIPFLYLLYIALNFRLDNSEAIMIRLSSMWKILQA